MATSSGHAGSRAPKTDVTCGHPHHDEHLRGHIPDRTGGRSLEGGRIDL